MKSRKNIYLFIMLCSICGMLGCGTNEKTPKETIQNTEMSKASIEENTEKMNETVVEAVSETETVKEIGSENIEEDKLQIEQYLPEYSYGNVKESLKTDLQGKGFTIETIDYGYKTSDGVITVKNSELGSEIWISNSAEHDIEIFGIHSGMSMDEASEILGNQGAEDITFSDDVATRRFAIQNKYEVFIYAESMTNISIVVQMYVERESVTTSNDYIYANENGVLQLSLSFSSETEGTLEMYLAQLDAEGNLYNEQYEIGVFEYDNGYAKYLIKDENYEDAGAMFELIYNEEYGMECLDYYEDESYVLTLVPIECLEKALN